jgi:hypothetical protein
MWYFLHHIYIIFLFCLFIFTFYSCHFLTIFSLFILYTSYHVVWMLSYLVWKNKMEKCSLYYIHRENGKSVVYFFYTLGGMLYWRMCETSFFFFIYSFFKIVIKCIEVNELPFIYLVFFSLCKFVFSYRKLYNWFKNYSKLNSFSYF